MHFCIIGQTEAGNDILANWLSSQYPDHLFISISYNSLGETHPELSDSDSVIVTVNLLEGPMPGTRAAFEDCRKLNKSVSGFCLTREDEFNAQTTYGPHIKELVEIETRELASIYGYSDDLIPSSRIPILTIDPSAINNFQNAVLNYIETIK